jgi:hypothetical protein
MSDAATAGESAARQRGGDLHLSLDCPQCGATGWAPWASLKRGMSCPKCHCHFHIASNGQLRNDELLPRVRFHCPRCHQAGAIPATFKIRKAKCGVCKLPLEIGPDEQLHGAKEAAEMRRRAAEASVASAASNRRLPDFLQQFLFQPDGKMRITNAVLVGILALGLLAAVVAGAGSLFASTPEGEVRAFTYACLAGDWNTAEQSLPANDDVALSEFKRWRGFYFTSILDKHRPAGDKVQVAVTRETSTPSGSVFVATLTSPLVGERTIREHWREHDGKWQFDVVATLAELQ